ncbi:MAG: hypothetical protein AAGF23_18135 [Acidobacteriota bacterium]
MRSRIVSTLAVFLLVSSSLLEVAGCRDHCELEVESPTPPKGAPAVPVSSATLAEDHGDAGYECPYCHLGGQRAALGPPQITWGLAVVSRSGPATTTPDLLLWQHQNPTGRGPPVVEFS